MYRPFRRWGARTLRQQDLTLQTCSSLSGVVVENHETMCGSTQSHADDVIQGAVWTCNLIDVGGFCCEETCKLAEKMKWIQRNETKWKQDMKCFAWDWKRGGQGAKMDLAFTPQWYFTSCWPKHITFTTGKRIIILKKSEFGLIEKRKSLNASDFFFQLPFWGKIPPKCVLEPVETTLGGSRW